MVYQVRCKRSGKIYIGSTQQSLKNRFKGHFDDVQKWFRSGTLTDSFAKHFAGHFSTKPTTGQIRELCEFKILSRINPFSFTKGIRTHGCRLCMAEKAALVSEKYKGKNLINDNYEIYGPCRHRSKFHRFPCTDERNRREKDLVCCSNNICRSCTVPSKTRTPLGDISNRQKRPVPAVR